MRYILLLFVTVLMMAGCAGAQKEAYDEFSSLGEPRWVAAGSGAFEAKEGRVFYGVGVSSDMKNKTLLTQTADDRAKSEVLKVVDAFVRTVINDYRVVNPQADFAALEQDMKGVTSILATSVQVVRHWTNPVTGAVYSLARVYLYGFKDDLGEFRNLDEVAGKYIKQNAERLHDKMIRRPFGSQSPQTTTN